MLKNKIKPLFCSKCLIKVLMSPQNIYLDTVLEKNYPR
jgi:hypothetical protein